jgi:hypothetical protein
MREEADRRGVSVHSLHVAILNWWSRHQDKVQLSFRGVHREKQPTEQLIVEMRLALAERLHRTARQMGDTSGKATKPTALARAMLMDYCGMDAYAGTMDEIARTCRKDYADGVPFMGQLTRRVEYRAKHPCFIRLEFDELETIRAVSQAEGKNMAQFARDIFNEFLPMYLDLEDEPMFYGKAGTCGTVE